MFNGVGVGNRSCGHFQADINNPGLLNRLYAAQLHPLLLVCGILLHWHRDRRPSTCGCSNICDNEGFQTESGKLIHFVLPLFRPDLAPRLNITTAVGPPTPS